MDFCYKYSQSPFSTDLLCLWNLFKDSTIEDSGRETFRDYFCVLKKNRKKEGISWIVDNKISI